MKEILFQEVKIWNFLIEVLIIMESFNQIDRIWDIVIIMLDLGILLIDMDYMILMLMIDLIIEIILILIIDFNLEIFSMIMSIIEDLMVIIDHMILLDMSNLKFFLSLFGFLKI